MVINRIKLYQPRNKKKGCNADWCEVGRSELDNDGFYQIVYKHTGKPTDYRMLIVGDQNIDTPDSNCGNSDQLVNLKGNEFEEVNYFGQPDSCQ